MSRLSRITVLILFSLVWSLVQADSPMTLAYSNGSSSEVPPSNRAGASWYNETPWRDPERGFLWYPPETKPIKKKPEIKQTAPETKPKSIKEMQSLEDIRKELDRLKELAILNPTESNVHEFLQAQAWVMDKSSTFADVARRVAWQKPDVDYNVRSPVANFALSNKRDRQKDINANVLATLGQDNGLLFFYKSDCQYCHEQAPILKLLETRYGLPILAISLDGGVMRLFPDAKPDNGISTMVSGGQGISVTPTLFLLNRKTKEAIPIGQGVMAMDEIVERIYVLTQTKPGQEF